MLSALNNLKGLPQGCSLQERGARNAHCIPQRGSANAPGPRVPENTSGVAFQTSSVPFSKPFRLSTRENRSCIFLQTWKHTLDIPDTRVIHNQEHARMQVFRSLLRHKASTHRRRCGARLVSEYIGSEKPAGTAETALSISPRPYASGVLLLILYHSQASQALSRAGKEAKYPLGILTKHPTCDKGKTSLSILLRRYPKSTNTTYNKKTEINGASYCSFFIEQHCLLSFFLFSSQSTSAADIVPLRSSTCVSLVRRLFVLS
ncbi:hypothetical protein EI42_00815 [Thermosporothrix hazakensis]|uniref:Uncharacterized protein n=1 Tax=Thermosporothrix hazakensis TaxID=644383 RepID=A0A326UEB7_THEHA|nr:hypothetical protein EI42_00815 [Thermosporothrix hazakensis]